MTSVQSSNISKIGWEDEVLEVEFVKGGKYRYTGVPADIYKILLNADSVGKAFHRYIRPKQHEYKYEKI
jgi:hypothetical protein